MSIEQNICQSIDIIVQKRLEEASFDKTIQATILNCEDASIGKYKVKYQDSTFAAYSSGSDILYANGTEVLILIPGNDMSKDKTILSAINRSNGAYAVVNPDAFVTIGNAFVSTDYTFQAGVCSYTPGEDELYLYNKNLDNNLINIDQNRLSYYIANANAFKVTADFTTELANEQQVGAGKYGLEIALDFYNTNKEIITKTYVFDTNSFVGQIYKLIRFTAQESKEFILDKDNFVGINYIRLFCKNFPNSNASITKDDIFVSNIKMYARLGLTEEEIQGTVVKIDASENGTIFDSDDEAKILKSVLYVKGVQSNWINECYWFQEDLRVENGDEGYSDMVGPGWRLLNELPYQEIAISKDQLISPITRIKCIVIHLGQSYSAEVKLQASIPATSIVSDNGTTFYLGLGKFNLTCLINGVSIPSGYTYSWGVETDEEFKLLNDTDNSILVKANTIGNKSIFKCEAFNGDNESLGIASIEVENKEALEGDYKLEIINGVQTFKYNEGGLAPTSDLLDSPMEIKPLSFRVYDNLGRVLADEDIAGLDVIQWIVPSVDTMLAPPADYDYVIDTSNHVYIVNDLYSFNYNIKDAYDKDNDRNNIQLIIDFYGKVLQAETSFIFIKEGEPGTNGTNFYCRLVPTQTGEIFKGYPTVYRNYNGGLTYNFPTNGSNWFIAKLWENGTKVEYKNASYKILQNKGDVSDYHITGNTYSYTGAGGSTPSNIIQATVITTTGNVHYASLGMITSKSLTSANYKVYLKYPSGFNYVLYSSDGKNPSYINLPFELEVFNSSGVDVSLDNNITYTWSTIGGNLNPVVNYSLAKNAKKFKPIDTFDGYAVNNAIICTVSYAGSAVASIHIPVHMYLNRYGNSAINGWDGNSVSIDDEGNGVILAPQIGAGKKEADNSFTGMVMGTVKTGNNIETGLVGYNTGTRTIFLDAETGNATFGAANKGQIKITPTEGVIRSGNFSSSAGLEIDFYDPHIKYGNGKFEVNKEGKLTATEASITGAITATSLSLEEGVKIDYSNIENAPEVPTIPDNILTTDDVKISTSTVKGLKTQSITVGTNTYTTITSSDGSYLLTNVGVGTYQDPSNTNPTNTYFQVDTDGLLKANNAIIYGTIYATNGRFSGEISASTITGTTINNGNGTFFVDTTGKLTCSNVNITGGALTIGNNFSVTNEGVLTCKKATVGTGSSLGGWTVYHDYILMSAYYNSEKEDTDVNTGTKKKGLYYGIALDSRPDAFQNAKDIRIFSAGWLGSGGEGPNKESSVANGSWANAAFSIFASGNTEIKRINNWSCSEQYILSAVSNKIQTAFYPNGQSFYNYNPGSSGSITGSYTMLILIWRVNSTTSAPYKGLTIDGEWVNFAAPSSFGYSWTTFDNA